MISPNDTSGTIAVIILASVASLIISTAIIIVFFFRKFNKKEPEDSRIDFNKWHNDNNEPT